MSDLLNERLCAELANVPLAKPGFDTLSMSSPMLVQINPGGKWENAKPASLDENLLRATVQHFVNSDAMPSERYCHQCAAIAKRESGRSNYVPVIMMPALPASDFPFDIEKQIQHDEVDKAHKSPKGRMPTESDTDADKDKKKPKKRGWVMQRLTDFDLLSQW